jgi:hypothetical protein
MTKQPTKLYDRKRLSTWVATYLAARTLGTTVTKLLGIQQCEDCGIDRSRWELVTGQFGQFYQCQVCHRFIGYVKEPKR